VQVWVICLISDWKVKVEHLVGKRTHKLIALRFSVRVWRPLACTVALATMWWSPEAPPPLWVHQFIMVPPQVEALTCLYRCCWLLRNGPTQGTYTAVVGFSAMDRLPPSYPSSNWDFDTTVRSWGEAGDPPTSRQSNRTSEREPHSYPKP